MIATVFALTARLLMALLFIVEGADKLLQNGKAREAFTAAELSPDLALPFGIVQIILGLMLALGAWTRTVAVILAVLVLAEMLFFYSDFTDGATSALALRNIAIAGGLLSLFAYGQSRWGYDALRERRRAELAERDARLRETERAREEEVARGYAERNRAPDVRPVSDRPTV